jgi:hypothetical protein
VYRHAVVFGAMWTCPRCGRAFANRNQTHTCAPVRTVEEHFLSSEPVVRELFDAVVAVASACGPVTVLPEKTRIALAARMSFAALVPRARRLDGHLVLARRLESPRFTRVETFSPRNHLHAFRLDTLSEVDEEFAGWMREAYALGMQRHLDR